MMFWSVVYAVVVAALAASVAALVELVLRSRGSAARGVWLAAIAVTLVLSLTRVVTNATPPETSITRAVRVAAVERAAPALAAAIDRVSGLDPLLIGLWWISAFLACVAVIGAWRKLGAGRADWRRARVQGEEVMVSTSMGPCTVGLFRTAIVVPGWLCDLRADQQRLILAHEREHLAGRDHLAWGSAIGALVLMPWNPALWWLVARLRSAIEVDCDRRLLLSRPQDADLYASTLLDVGERLIGREALALPFLGANALEARLHYLTGGGRRSGLKKVMAGAAAALLVIVLLGLPNPVRLACSALSAVTIMKPAP